MCPAAEQSYYSPTAMKYLNQPTALDRRTFLRRSAILGSLAAAGPFHALGLRVANGAPPPSSAGYGPLVPKGDLALPHEF